MRILLVQPAPFEDRRLGLENTFWLSEPVALTSIAAMVPEHDVKVLDMRLESGQVLPDVLAQFKPHIVGTTAMTTDAYQAQSVLRLARQLVPNALTMVGGHHCTMLPSFYKQPYVDVIVKGEGEQTFRSLVDAWQGVINEGGQHDTSALSAIKGTEVRVDNTWTDTGKADWLELDDLPVPNRQLLDRYKNKYFFLAGRPMASFFTSRGCSYDCNFCAIWEFYDRRTRFLSAEKIVDQMEACDEPFLFFLDDNFLSRTDRLEKLCDEIERRGVKKYWMTQGRTDFVAKHPELMARLARAGLTSLLCGFETNAQNTLDELRKRNTVECNKKAAQILRDNGILTTGIFMVRPDFEEQDFQILFDTIAELGVTFPLVTIHTPLPGTQLYHKYKDQLLTEDYRLYDLLHAVLPTKLPREEFYKNYVQWKRVYRASRNAWMTTDFLRKRWHFLLTILPHMPKTAIQGLRYQRIQFDHRSYLRDEEGIITQNTPMHAPPTPDETRQVQSAAK